MAEKAVRRRSLEVKHFVIERLAEMYASQEVARMIAREFPDEPHWGRWRVAHFTTPD